MYEETIHVPLYVRLANTTQTQDCYVMRCQMVSAVDFCPLVVDLAYGYGIWRNLPQYQDIRTRQCIALYCYHKYDPEIRLIPSGLQSYGSPYILTTTDEDLGGITTMQKHVVCIRVNQYPVTTMHPNPSALGKFAIYSAWTACTITPATSPSPQYEFYDYSTNPNEIGNDVNYINGPVCVWPNPLACQLLGAIDPSSPSSLFATELRKPLQSSMYQCAQMTGINAYLNYEAACGLQPCGTSPPTCSN